MVILLFCGSRLNMLVLITYDVDTTEAIGRKRLRQVSKLCLDHGQRVQNSVFECLLDNSEFKVLKEKLLEIIDLNKDSIRFYNLGNKYSNRIEQYGIKDSYNPEGSLII